jgi:hypothetical protein
MEAQKYIESDAIVYGGLTMYRMYWVDLEERHSTRAIAVVSTQYSKICNVELLLLTP